jgi:hypothetical protein
MLAIIEIVLFICGVVGLISGKLPSLVFGKKYRIEGPGARLISALLVLPLPIALLGGVVLGLLMGNQAVGIAWIFEIALLILCFVAAAVISRRVRQPATLSTESSALSTGDNRTP